MQLKQRMLRLLTSFDAFAFAVMCMGNVKQGECASSAAWDCLLHGRWQGGFVRVIDSIFFFDPNHCANSWQWQRKLYQ